jgi:hypothetical protein
VKIEIDLANLGFHYDEDGDRVGNKSLEDAIVQAAANKLLSGMEYPLRSQIDDYLKSVAKEHIAGIVNGVLSEPIQRREQWGDKKGEPVTIREIVRVQLQAFMSAPTPRDRYGNSGPANLTELVDQIVRGLLQKELAEDVRAIKKEVSDQLRTKALRAAVEALKP